MNACVGHVSLLVNDMKESVDFYCKAFDLKVLRYYEGADRYLTWVGKTAWAEPSFLEIRVEKNRSGPYEHGDPENHFCMSVEDRETQREWYKRHEAMGIIDKLSPNGYFIHDPNGYSIEILSAESVANMIAGRENVHFLKDV